jgi:hypothetical protein
VVVAVAAIGIAACGVFDQGGIVVKGPDKEDVDTSSPIPDEPASDPVSQDDARTEQDDGDPAEPLPALESQTALSDYAVLAQRRLVVGPDAVVQGGGLVGVLEPCGGESPLTCPSVLVRERAEVAKGWGALVADVVQIDDDAVVGDVFASVVRASRSGTVARVLPWVTMPAIPKVTPPSQSCVGAEPLTVEGESGRATLEPNGQRHGDVRVEYRARLMLGAGAHYFESLEVEEEGMVKALGPVDIYVSGYLRLGPFARLTEYPEIGLTADAIRVYVAGKDVWQERLSRHRPAVDLGERSFVMATLVAPNGTVLIGPEARAAGAYMGREVELANGAVVTKQDGFPPEASRAVSMTCR